MAPGKPMKGLAGEELLRNLTLELDAVGAVLGHGFHPLKARHTRSIPCASPVRARGRTPEQRSGLSPAVVALRPQMAIGLGVDEADGPTFKWCRLVPDLRAQLLRYR